MEYARDHVLVTAKAMLTFITRVQPANGHLDINMYYKRD